MSLNNVKVQINQTNGRLQTTAPLSLRNAARDSTFIQNLESIQNVTAVNRVDGAGLQYNSETQNYEVKLVALDGGSF